LVSLFAELGAFGASVIFGGGRFGFGEAPE
jgi:hypothetical protein